MFALPPLFLYLHIYIFETSEATLIWYKFGIRAQRATFMGTKSCLGQFLLRGYNKPPEKIDHCRSSHNYYIDGT
jgi:hypothetical protein